MASDLPRILAERAEAAGLTIAPALERQLLAYYDVLVHWNRKINLTSLVEPAQAVDRLLIEPLAAAPHLPAGARIADLGSGGGSPAIPLALALGAPHLLMVESRARKAAFLREAARAVGLLADVEAVRFEELRGKHALARAADLVSIRAVRQDQLTMDVARWLAREGGLIALFLSKADQADLPRDSSTWNIMPSAMLVTFHVEHL